MGGRMEEELSIIKSERTVVHWFVFCALNVVLGVMELMSHASHISRNTE